MSIANSLVFKGGALKTLRISEGMNDDFSECLDRLRSYVDIHDALDRNRNRRGKTTFLHGNEYESETGNSCWKKHIRRSSVLIKEWRRVNREISSSIYGGRAKGKKNLGEEELEGRAMIRRVPWRLYNKGRGEQKQRESGGPSTPNTGSGQEGHA
jgi:hypothetical protein